DDREAHARERQLEPPRGESAQRADDCSRKRKPRRERAGDGGRERAGGDEPASRHTRLAERALDRVRRPELPEENRRREAPAADLPARAARPREPAPTRGKQDGEPDAGERVE